MTILRCVTTLIYGLLLTQAAIAPRPKVSMRATAKASGKLAKAKPMEAKPMEAKPMMAMTAATSAPRVPSAVLPRGTGPLTAVQLANLDFKATVPPPFVEQMRMPVVTVTPGVRPDLRAVARTEIRSTGIVQKIIQAKGLQGADADPDKVTALIESGLQAALNQADVPRALSPPRRRLMGLFDDILGFFEDVGCGAFATGALAGYLAAYGVFHACNSGYVGLTPHQKYFQRGVYGLDILNKVNVKYGACFPVGFDSAAATTMGTEIYVRAGPATTDINAITNIKLSTGFQNQLMLLMHELGHSKQYADRGWSVSSFGWKYMEQYCQAGFSYSGNSMEKEADAQPAKIATLVLDPVLAHFKKWRKDGLNAVATYSKSPKEYTNLNIGGKAIMSLDLNKVGIIKDGESQRKAGTRCVRILRGSELSSRALAEVPGKPWDCVDTTKAPTKTPTRKPTSPTLKPTYGVVVTGPLGLTPTPKPTPKPTFGNIGTGPIGLTPTQRPTVMIPIPKATAGKGTAARAALIGRQQDKGDK